MAHGFFKKSVLLFWSQVDCDSDEDGHDEDGDDDDGCNLGRAPLVHGRRGGGHV